MGIETGIIVAIVGVAVAYLGFRLGRFIRNSRDTHQYDAAACGDCSCAVRPGEQDARQSEEPGSLQAQHSGARQ